MYKLEKMKNCPFCNGKIYEWNEDYFACCHLNGCFMVTVVNQDWRTANNVTIILKREDYINAWNKRPNDFENKWKNISAEAIDNFTKTKLKTILKFKKG